MIGFIIVSLLSGVVCSARRGIVGRSFVTSLLCRRSRVGVLLSGALFPALFCYGVHFLLRFALFCILLPLPLSKPISSHGALRAGTAS